MSMYVSLYMSLVAHRRPVLILVSGALSPLDEIVYHRVTHSTLNLYPFMCLNEERHYRVKCLAQELKTAACRPGLKPRWRDPMSSAIIINRSPYLSNLVITFS